MAADLCSEASPRISFSHDLNQTNILPLQSDISLLDTEFEFSISDIFEQESSSADELFSHGIILPLQFHEKPYRSRNPINSEYQQPRVSPASLPVPSITENTRNVSLKKLMVENSESEEKVQCQSKSFWSFKRSSSLNHEGHKKGLLCSFPLLSRSSSTGSTLNTKKILTSKDDNQKKQNLSRNPSVPLPKSSSTTTSNSFYSYQQKSQSKKNSGGTSYGHGVRISPVLNVPPPYISSGTSNLFGFGSLFRNGKDKKPKKRL